MAKKTEAAEPTTCACSQYDALIPEQLTEANLESANYDVFDTGCAATTTRVFAPGHDAKLKSFLIRHGALGHDIRHTVGGVASSAAAMDHARKYDFAHMVAAGIQKAMAKAEARANREAARAERKAEKAAKPAKATGSLADIVADEEAKHAAGVAASQPTPEWDDVLASVTQERAEAPEGRLMRRTRAWVGGARLAGEIREIDDQAWFVYQGKNGTERTREYDEGSAVPAPATTDLTGLPEVIAKIGRWSYKGIVSDAGVFHYLAKDGQTRKTAEAGKFTVVSEV